MNYQHPDSKREADAPIRRIRPGLYVRELRPKHYLVVYRIAPHAWRFARLTWFQDPGLIVPAMIDNVRRQTFPTYDMALSAAEGNWTK